MIFVLLFWKDRIPDKSTTQQLLFTTHKREFNKYIDWTFKMKLAPLIGNSSILTLWWAVSVPLDVNAYTVRFPSTRAGIPTNVRRAAETSTTTTTMMMFNEDTPDPTTFRQAEVLGLRLMQEGNFQEALVGTRFTTENVVVCMSICSQ